jgi:hypothetical protein
VAQVDDDEPRLAVERAVVGESRAAAVGECVTACVARILPRDAIGKGVDEDVADGSGRTF